MTTKILFGVGLAAAIALSAPAAWSQDKASQTFIKNAIEGNLAEIQMGQLAQKNGSSEGVRSFGQMLERDHTDANQKAMTGGQGYRRHPAKPTEREAEGGARPHVEADRDAF